MATMTTSSRPSFQSSLTRFQRALKRPESADSSDSSSSFFSERGNKTDSEILDDDVKGTVKRFLRDFSKKYYGSHLPAEMIHLISKWLCKELQQERNQWNLKLQNALNQSEIQRRNGLANQTLINICLERLHMLVDCCNLQDDNGKPFQLPGDISDDSHKAVLFYSQTLMEAFSHLVEDQFQCMELLKPDPFLSANVENLSVVNLLKEHITQHEKMKSNLMSKSQQSLKEKQQSVSKAKQTQNLESMVRGLESEVGKLRLELKKEKDNQKTLTDAADQKHTLKSKLKQLENDVKRLRKLCNKKEDYIDWLKKQFFEMTQLVEDDQRKHESKLRAKQYDDKEQTKAKLKLETLNKEICLTKAPPYIDSEVSDASRGTTMSIEISEDKLNILKNKAQKLEDSLKDALKQMQEYKEKSTQKPESKFTTVNDDLQTHGVVLRVPKQINLLKSAMIQKSKDQTVSDKPPRNSKIEKSFKELQNTFSNRHGTQRLGQTVSIATASVTTIRKNQMSKCFRCKKIFKPSDNHKMSCCFHTKGKERIEKYSEDGKLKQVVFVWQCCGQNLDSTGCSTGQHV